METEVEKDQPLPAGVEAVADGVYLMKGDLRGAMNIYFIRGPEGELVQFDAGTRSMTKKNVKAARALGGLDQVIVSHAHADHRGTAPGLLTPVLCHPDEVGDLRSPASIAGYMDLSELDIAPIAWLYRFLLPWWDGGPVEPDGTVQEGDTVAGFEVVHVPGHAPGLIGLW
ncbi:MAG: MBL fold metallo-hydrolase, partial [Solirubrobacterales bacterium]